MPRPLLIPGGVMMSLPPPPPIEEREELMEQLQAILPSDPVVQVEHRFEEGDPVAGILDVAGELSCELIVMGTHGRTGLGRVLMGSVAEQVMRKAPCPVLTVRTPAAQMAERKGQLLSAQTV
jgi:universal stress protein A